MNSSRAVPFQTTKARLEAALRAFHAEAAAAVDMHPNKPEEVRQAAGARLKRAHAAIGQHLAECRAIYAIAVATAIDISDMTLGHVLEAGEVGAWFVIATA